MFGRAIRLLTVLAMLNIALAARCLGQQPETSKNRDAATRLSRLIAIVESNENPDRDLAIRTLAEMKAQAAPAVPVLCTVLSDRQHGTRASAVDAQADALAGMAELVTTSLRAGAVPAANIHACIAFAEGTQKVARNLIHDLRLEYRMKMPDHAQGIGGSVKGRDGQ